MKTVILFLIIGCSLSSLFAQNNVRVNGMVKEEARSEVALYITKDGELHEYAKTAVAADGSFYFLFHPAEAGFYAVGNKNRGGVCEFYAKPGDEVNLEIRKDGMDLVDKMTQENKIWANWKRCSLPFVAQFKASDQREYIRNFPGYLPDLQKYKKQINSGNRRFDELMKIWIDYETGYKAMMAYYLANYQSERLDLKNVPEFVSALSRLNKFDTDDILVFPQGKSLMMNYLKFQRELKGSAQTDIPEDVALFVAPGLKGEYMLGIMERMLQVSPSLRTHQKIFDEYGHFFVNQSQKERYESLKKGLPKLSPRDAGYNFSYPDINGNKVSFSDFRGKVVVVDVWATWCGPCRAEIPAFKALEQQMRDRNVVFVGISLDSDPVKWKQFVKKEALEGVQLRALPDKAFYDYYEIKGIPRFMVFDKEGKVVSSNAARPSMGQTLKKMIEEELNK